MDVDIRRDRGSALQSLPTTEVAESCPTRPDLSPRAPRAAADRAAAERGDDVLRIEVTEPATSISDLRPSAYPMSNQ